MSRTHCRSRLDMLLHLQQQRPIESPLRLPCMSNGIELAPNLAYPLIEARKKGRRVHSHIIQVIIINLWSDLRRRRISRIIILPIDVHETPDRKYNQPPE